MASAVTESSPPASEHQSTKTVENQHSLYNSYGQPSSPSPLTRPVCFAQRLRISRHSSSSRSRSRCTWPSHDAFSSPEGCHPRIIPKPKPLSTQLSKKKLQGWSAEHDVLNAHTSTHPRPQGTSPKAAVFQIHGAAGWVRVAGTLLLRHWMRGAVVLLIIFPS